MAESNGKRTSPKGAIHKGNGGFMKQCVPYIHVHILQLFYANALITSTEVKFFI